MHRFFMISCGLGGIAERYSWYDEAQFVLKGYPNKQVPQEGLPVPGTPYSTRYRQILVTV